MDDIGAEATAITSATVPDNQKSAIEADTEITSIHYRAQEVQPGGLFVAIKGLAADGHDYIETAVARGAEVDAGLPLALDEGGDHQDSAHDQADLDETQAEERQHHLRKLQQRRDRFVVGR